MIRTIKDVVTILTGKPGNHRLLVVFLQVAGTATAEGTGAPVQGGGWARVIHGQHYAVGPELTFDSIVADGDAVSREWNVMVVAPAENTGANEAERFLVDLGRRILSGVEHEFMTFDRNERPLPPLRTTAVQSGRKVH